MKEFKFKIFQKEYKLLNIEGGMTYAELIVVLSIFAIISSVTIFNYGKFQAKIDIENLASDIALQITQAQKEAIGGKLDSLASVTWKPSYGVSFDIASNNKLFTYFADRNSDGALTGSSCNGECLSSIGITKGNSISSLAVVGSGTCSSALTKIDITFTRPDSTATFVTSPASSGCTISYAEVTISSPKSLTSSIKIYPLGRVQIN